MFVLGWSGLLITGTAPLREVASINQMDNRSAVICALPSLLQVQYRLPYLPFVPLLALGGAWPCSMVFKVSMGLGHVDDRDGLMPCLRSGMTTGPGAACMVIFSWICLGGFFPYRRFLTARCASGCLNTRADCAFVYSARYPRPILETAGRSVNPRPPT